MEAAQVREPVLDAPVDTMLYEQLLDRQQRLRDAEFENLVAADVSRLLGEVDEALTRFNKGTFGLCEECHDPIEPERLIADPLIKLCLGDLTQKQLDAIQEDLQLAAEIQKLLGLGQVAAAAAAALGQQNTANVITAGGQTLQNTVAKVEADIPKLEDWFNSIMDRVSE